MSEKELMQLSSINTSHNVISLFLYEIEKKIGKGQFSEVYKAQSKRDGSKVALKKIHINEMTEAKARHNWMKEIDILQKLNHPNIIKYLVSFVEMNILHIVLELADAGDLSKFVQYFIKQRRLISEKTIWKFLMQITSGLQHMHSKRIMHRDIKPANIFLTSQGVVKLGDLGIGRFFSNMTVAAYSLVGTPYYMSPEVINECGYNFKSDIWSLGCLLYELGALRSPFFSEKINLHSLCKKIEISDYPPLPSEIYSKTLRDLIASCLRSDPESRPDVSYIHLVSQEMNKFDALSVQR